MPPSAQDAQDRHPRELPFVLIVAESDIDILAEIALLQPRLPKVIGRFGFLGFGRPEWLRTPPEDPQPEPRTARSQSLKSSSCPSP